jgi:hypothetical protein
LTSGVASWYLEMVVQVTKCAGDHGLALFIYPIQRGRTGTKIGITMHCATGITCSSKVFVGFVISVETLPQQ